MNADRLAEIEALRRFPIDYDVLDLIAALREARELAERLANAVTRYEWWKDRDEIADALAAFDAAKETW